MVIGSIPLFYVPLLTFPENFIQIHKLCNFSSYFLYKQRNRQTRALGGEPSADFAKIFVQGIK